MNLLIVGLTFKTGSAYVAPSDPASSRLPTGDIRWGLSKFETEQGRFMIDHNDVDVHVKEIKRLENSAPSLFSAG